MSIYFDNAATTKPCQEAVEAVNRGLSELWGNPSSLHSMGLDAQLAVDEARKIIADSNEIVVDFIASMTDDYFVDICKNLHIDDSLTESIKYHEYF